MTQDGDASKNHALGPPSAGISHMEPFGETSIGSLIECTVTPRYGIRRLTEGTVISNKYFLGQYFSALFGLVADGRRTQSIFQNQATHHTMTDGGKINPLSRLRTLRSNAKE